MKSFLKNTSIALLLSTALLLTCKNDELKDIGFPRVHTNFVEMISDTGAVFSGEIIDMPSGSEIIDHGFVWSDNKDAVNYLEKVSLGNRSEKGSFQAIANRAMIEGKTYFFKAYVKTKTVTVFGNEVEFVSLGSHAPVITSLFPDSASWNDTITIHGKYFAYSNMKMQVMFQDIIAGSSVFESDKSGKIVIPASLETVFSKISIKYENVVYPSDKVFKLIPNTKITSIEPLSGSWNSVVKIRGRNLRLTQNVYFDKTLAPFKTMSDSLIEVKVPYNLNATNSDISIEINNFEFYAPQKFTLLPSKIDSIYPNKITSGSLAYIKGKDFRKTNLKVFLDKKEAPIKEISDTLICIVVPKFDVDGIKTFLVEDGVFKYTPKQSVEYLTPELSSFIPHICTWGDTITVIGRNLELIQQPKIYISDGYSYESITYVKIVSYSSNNIKFIVPENYNLSKLKITIENSNPTLSYFGELKLLEPIIEDIIYDKNSFTQPIIIKGKYFHPKLSGVEIIVPEDLNYFTKHMKTISISGNEIKCKYPSVISGKYKIQIVNYISNIEMYSNSLEKELISPFNFFYHTLYSLSNQKLIHYKNEAFFFDPEYQNQRIFKLDINTKAFSTIGSYPSISRSANFQISSKAFFCTGDSAGYINQRCFSFDMENKNWERLPDFPGEARRDAIGFQIGSKGYLIGGINLDGVNLNDFWEFDSNNKTWTKKDNLSFKYYEIDGIFEYNNEAYILEKSTLWKYNPIQNSISIISQAPVDQYFRISSAFCINHKAYFYSYYGLWQYDILSKKWDLKFDPIIDHTSISHPFEYNNEIYFFWDRSLFNINMQMLQ